MRDDGVIKFSCRHESGPPPTGIGVAELIAYRQMLFCRNLIGVYPDGVGFGNISVRVAPVEDGKFIVSASQTGHIEDMRDEHCSLIRDYSLDGNWVACCGPLPASSESLTHALIYDTFPAMCGVIHIHAMKPWQALQGLAPTSSEDVPYGTPAMANEVVRLARDSTLARDKILVMAGHEEGILTFGHDLKEAYQVLNTWLQRSVNRVRS